MPKKSEIGKLASVETEDEFADELSSYTSLTASEIKALFPEKTDREELLELLKIVGEKTDENTKKTRLIAKINKVGGAVIKIVSKFVPGL